MTLAVLPKLENTDELQRTIERATEHIHECDSILIIMQKKESGMLWFAPDSGRIETASFMAMGFLQWLHSRKA